MTQKTQDLPFYLVGSMPPTLISGVPYPSPEEMQRFLAEHAGPNAIIGGGEVRPEEQVWIVPYSNKIAKAAGIPSLEKFSSEVWHYPFRLTLGVLFANRHMTADKVPEFGYPQMAKEDRAAFDKFHKPGAVFMRGVTSAVAIKMFSGAMFTDVTHLEDKIAQDIRDIQANKATADTVFQIEVPFEMFIDAMLPESMEKRQRKYAKQLQSAERIIRQTPKGTRYAFHLCWGDLGGRPAVPKWRQKVGAKIAMLNAIAAMSVWNEGWELFAVHDPFGDGVHAPRLSQHDLDEYKQSLAPLPANALYAIGILHNKISAEAVAPLVGSLQDVLRGKGVTRFALSTHCGLGRKSTADTIALFEQKEAVNHLLARG